LVQGQGQFILFLFVVGLSTFPFRLDDGQGLVSGRFSLFSLFDHNHRF
jgi:hypothetical protein